jgi:hypothetical protein
MQPGVYMGQRYDGVMTNIRANHVALVEAGRAGSDVVVMDSKPKEAVMQYLSPRAAWMAGSAHSYLLTKMAQDQKVPDLKPIFAGVTAKNWATKRAAVEAAIVRVTRGKLAQDAEVHIHEHLDGAGAGAPPDPVPPGGAPDADLAFGGAAAEDPNGAPPVDPNATEDNPVADPAVDPNTDVVATVQQLLQGNIDDNTLAIVLNALKNPPPPQPEADAPDAPPDDDDDNGGSTDKKAGAADEGGEIDKDLGMAKGAAMDRRPVTKVAMDAAIEKAVTDAVNKTTLRLNKRDDAKQFVRPWIGDIAVAMDSAQEVYKFALEQMGEDVADIHPSAYKAILNKIPKPGEQQQRAPAAVAMDRDTNKQFLERFPHANRLMKH